VDADKDCFVYLRQAGGERKLIALNFVGEGRRVSVPNGGTGRIALSTHMDRAETVSLADLKLRSFEGVIVEL
jgi:hypothetical protein